MGLDRIDELVRFEIDMAVTTGVIPEAFGGEVWCGWCGSGEEVMRYGTALDENGMDSPML